MLSTMFLLAFSTCFMATSTTSISPPNCFESSAIAPTRSLIVCIVCRLVPINSKMVVIDSVIFAEVSSKEFNASIILLDEFFVPWLKVLISSATTENPFPCSPALAASIEAFNANKLV